MAVLAKHANFIAFGLEAAKTFFNGQKSYQFICKEVDFLVQL